MGFEKHKFLIACVGIAVAVALFTGVFAVMGWSSLLSEAGASILYPFQWVTAKVGEAATGFGRYFSDMDKLRAENESLRAEVDALRGELIDSEILADESAWLYQYLSMKEEHADYALCAAIVVASEGGTYVTEITLNKGTSSGIEAGMPVVTRLGLVGVVVEVGGHFCRVSTILDPLVSVGAVTARASEKGMCEGDYARLHEGRTVLRYLPGEADVLADDLVLTGGQGSVYPYGIPVGRVESVAANAFSRTTEAVVLPFVDFSNLTQVMILTDYVHTVAPPAGETPMGETENGA